MLKREPDALTSREREVLSLVRLGLTNEEIAQRLGITLDGAKYHVSQILSKLGVSSREEAAAVAAEGHRRWWLTLALWAKIAGAATVAAAAGGLALLTWGVLETSDEANDPSESQRASPDEPQVIETASQSLPRVTLARSPFGNAWYSPDGSSLWNSSGRKSSFTPRMAVTAGILARRLD